MGSTLRTSNRGKRGQSDAAAQFLDGKIAEPTAAALDEWRRRPAVEAAQTGLAQIGDALIDFGEAGSLALADLELVAADVQADAAAFLDPVNGALAKRLRVDAAMGLSASSQAIGRANIKAAPVIVETVEGAAPNVDAYGLIIAAVAKVKAAGGGTVVLPRIGGAGYLSSEPIIVDASDIDIWLYDEARLSKATRSGFFIFMGSYGNHIRNVGLFGMGKRRVIDGNGAVMAGTRSIAGYDALQADGLASFSYAAVSFVWCTDWLCENVEGRNGLMNSLRAVQCGRGTFRRCAGTYAAYDNGISVDYDPSDKRPSYSDADPSTWSSAVVDSCEAHHNESLGMTSFGATGVTFINPLIYANGNDDLALPHNGGGLSVENDLRNMARNARCTVINPRIIGNANYGIFASLPGIEVIGGSVESTTLGPNRAAANTSGARGANIALLGSGSIKTSRTRVARAGLHNIRALAIGGSGTATTTPGSNQLIVSAGSGFQLGVILRGTGIPIGTTVVDGPTTGGAGTYTMSANATASGSSTVAWELFPSLDFDGNLERPAGNNLSLQGTADVATSAQTVMTLAGNGSGSTSYHVFATNAGAQYNTGQGTIRIRGRLEQSTHRAMDITGISLVFIENAYVRDPLNGQAATSAIRIQSANRVYVQNVTGSDGSAKTTYVVEIASSVGAAYVGKVAYSATGMTGLVSNSAATVIASI